MQLNGTMKNVGLSLFVWVLWAWSSGHSEFVPPVAVGFFRTQDECFLAKDVKIKAGTNPSTVWCNEPNDFL